MKTTYLCLVFSAASAWAQGPVIDPGGVVNGASYADGLGGRSFSDLQGGQPSLAAGSIASIFGSNLAASTLSAQPPLPRQLGATSVSVNGIAAPLFFVSPTQIDFQMPTGLDVTPGASSAQGIVVSTSAGQSAPYQLGNIDASPGIFTVDSSGCGRGAVLNVALDGSVSLNSLVNSAAPGSFVSVFGTGNGSVYNAPPDGEPAPSSPLAFSAVGGGLIWEFAQGGGSGSWVGRAPGLVGVDQFNFPVPTMVRQGCAVPLQIITDNNISAPVTMSIAAGGGACSDPPSQGYGEVTWEKTVTTSATYAVSESDTVTVSLDASPGRQAPLTPTFAEGGTVSGAFTYFGSQCPVPGYRSLDAGSVSAQGPGTLAWAAPKSPLAGGTVSTLLPGGGFAPFPQVQSSQVSGLTVYQAALPAGTIQPGSFTVSAKGGADVGAFQSTAQIGAPIQVITALAARVLNSQQPLQIQWTGGDANSWVTVKLVGHFGPYDYYPPAWVARATDGQIAIRGAAEPIGYDIAGPVDIVIEVVPDPSQVPSFAAPGLSLGGTTTWKYTYVFQGATAQ